ncbi:hypothetical protein A2U01_0115868, partial [Trifolium medium]|nr:hypothetical protein [Trifolium medium]
KGSSNRVVEGQEVEGPMVVVVEALSVGVDCQVPHRLVS